jgi:hypothetical protein
MRFDRLSLRLVHRNNRKYRPARHGVKQNFVRRNKLSRALLQGS